MTIGLSKSSLGVFKDCPRCFYLEKIKKVRRPRGIMASIINGVDRAMKRSVESSVLRNIEHPYLAQFPGAQPFSDRNRLMKFQAWQTFQAEFDGIKLWGELDDLISFPTDGAVAPWDFKSNGEERNWAEYVAKYYTLDGDVYHAILENGQRLKCTGKAYFTFTWPMDSADGHLAFGHHTIKVDTDPARAVELARKAVACLQGSEPPMASPGCEYCNFVVARQIANVRNDLPIQSREEKPLPKTSKKTKAVTA